MRCASQRWDAPDWRHLGPDRLNREERVVRMLEAPTLNVLNDNPGLVAYLTADDDA